MRSKLVRTFTEFVPDIAGNRQKMTLRVYYDSKADSFWMHAPDHLAQTAPTGYSEQRGGPDAPVVSVRTGDGKIFGKTPKEVEENLKRASYAYERAVTKVRKVIVYRLRHCAHDEWGNRENGGGLAFERGTGLIVHYEIGYEVKTGDKAFIWQYDPTATKGTICNNRTVGGHDYLTIDWTQPREDFFNDMTEKLEAMVSRARQFLGDEKKLALAIDTGKFDVLMIEHKAAKKP